MFKSFGSHSTTRAPILSTRADVAAWSQRNGFRLMVQVWPFSGASMPNNRISLPLISMVSPSSTLALPTNFSRFGLLAMDFSGIGVLVGARSRNVVPVNRKVRVTAPESPRMPRRISPKTDRNFAKTVRLFFERHSPQPRQWIDYHRGCTLGKFFAELSALPPKADIRCRDQSVC